uniref:Cytoplasmic tRNA 2-thiolation protein 2-A n=1 Tax=Schistocephalus solidus TaxID=70667 RepID=A0A0X3PZN6_SCHSO
MSHPRSVNQKKPAGWQPILHGQERYWKGSQLPTAWHCPLRERTCGPACAQQALIGDIVTNAMHLQPPSRRNLKLANHGCHSSPIEEAIAKIGWKAPRARPNGKSCMRIQIV